MNGSFKMNKFDSSLADSQAVEVTPVNPEKFDFDSYAEYAEGLNKKCESFRKDESGVMVYRRMRVAETFSYGCRDMERSLALQLGALEKSISFKADVPNFLEPWYGIGTIASAYGGEYIWAEGNAPAIKPQFNSLDQILEYNPKRVSETDIGIQTLNMIEYFIEKTKGMLPVSFCDIQSPLNIVTHLMPLDSFFLNIMTDPEKVLNFFDILADLSIEFNKEQTSIAGKALVYPGHGFASSSKWRGLGMSDDNAIMISPAHYLEIAAPSAVKVCKALGGPAFHSCGDWTAWIDAVLKMDGIVMADAALSPETDPGATDNLEAYHKFAGTGVILNARIVGDIDTIEKQVRRLWKPGLKLIVVTYCKTYGEQERAYNLIHEICV
jgi:uroporphyrinogen-III decarboxylase